MARPVLPFRHANPHLRQIDSGPLPPVKYQILSCHGQDILIGRIKITTPTESGHAFILRRFDTGGISLTTMFRAAFPSATEQDEKQETAWVKDNYNLKGYNGTTKELGIVRLAGTWVGPEAAIELGEAYSLRNVMAAVVQATPDPTANYRRSGKSAGKAEETPPTSPSKTLPSPSPKDAPTPFKKRKESSPVPSPADESSSTPAPRRSTRLKSPVPKPPSTRATRKSPQSKATRKDKLFTPEGSDETAVEDADGIESLTGEDLHEEDVAEQKAMIAGLKAQRDASKNQAAEEPPNLKRSRKDEENLHFEFKEPETGQRAIASNHKVRSFRLEPRTKAVAWGLAAFAVGWSAASFIPNFL